MQSASKPSLKKNILANFVGQGWSIFVGFLVVPLYIHFIGVEGYGLVGFYTTLQATFNSFLDFGISITINREIARYTVSPNKIGFTRDLVRTIEMIYWAIGLMLGIIVCSSASLIAVNWLHSENISIETLKAVIFLMGLITFFQWPLTFYQGGLIGLQKLVLLNGINVFFATFRGLGAVLILWLVSPSILAFFLWQLLSSILQLTTSMILLWRNLPTSDHIPLIRWNLLNDVWQFAVGMSATSFFSFFIGQADKIILSKFLSLEYFGYYSLATMLNNQLQLIASQILQPLFPRFSSLVSVDDVKELKALFHRASQFMSVIMFPVAGVLILFSRELIYIWTQDRNISTLVAPIASVLFIGTALLSLIEVSYSLTVAYGWVKFSFYRGLFSFILLMPLLSFLAWKFAGVGAAFAWMILNLAYVIILPPIMHRNILHEELRGWYIHDVGYPLISSVIVLMVARWCVPANLPTLAYVVILPFILLCTFGTVVMAANEIRKSGMVTIKNFYLRLCPLLYSLIF